MQLLEDEADLLVVTLLQDALDHAAAKRVGAEREHLVRERIHNELHPVCRHALDTPLDHVVGILSR